MNEEIAKRVIVAHPAVATVHTGYNFRTVYAKRNDKADNKYGFTLPIPENDEQALELYGKSIAWLVNEALKTVYYGKQEAVKKVLFGEDKVDAVTDESHADAQTFLDDNLKIVGRVKELAKELRGVRDSIIAVGAMPEDWNPLTPEDIEVGMRAMADMTKG